VPVFDLTIILGTLSVFEKTTMHEINQKSGKLTNYIEFLLQENLPTSELAKSDQLIEMITPASLKERGAQISMKIKVELVDGIMADMEVAEIVVDIRKPNIMRVTPVALYNTYRDVYHFVSVLTRSIKRQLEA
jgi:kynureninase